MFTLSKLVKKSESKTSKKENKSNDRDKKKQIKANNASSQSWTSTGSHVNTSKTFDIPGKNNFNEDIYVLNYKRESAFFAQDSDDSSELISTINNALRTVQTRSSCLDMLDISIDGCNTDKLTKHISHWTTSLANSFMTSTSDHEKEMSSKLLVKLIPRLHPTQESNQLLVTLTNHIVGKTIAEDSLKNDKYLPLKVKLLKEFLTCLPSLCGQHKGKYDKFFNILITHPDPVIQEMSAECLAMIPCTGGVGSSGQAHQENWSLSFNNTLKELSSILTSLEIELTGKSSKGNKDIYFNFVHTTTGLVRILGALLQQPQVKNFESKQVFDVIDQLLNIKLFSGLVRPYILQLHQLAFYLMETLLSRYCELISFSSNVIYEHMNQVLRDTCRKMTEEKPKFCTLRRAVYSCLKLCFLHNIFPVSMTSLNSIVKATIKDCIFLTEASDTSTIIATKMKVSSASHDAYSKKKRRSQHHFDPISDDHSQRGCKTRASTEEVEMCVSALEALNTLITCDSKLLHLSIMTEDKTVYPAMPSEESKRDSIMNAMVMPIWRFVIPQVRKLQGFWNSDPLKVTCSLGVYNSSAVKKALFQVISSITSLPLLRNTEAFNAACNLIRVGSSSRSEPEIQQLCRQTLQWLSFTLDHERHLKTQPSDSHVEDSIVAMDEELNEGDDANFLPSFEVNLEEQSSVVEDSSENVGEDDHKNVQDESNVATEPVSISQEDAEKVDNIAAEGDIIHGDDVDDDVDDGDDDEEISDSSEKKEENKIKQSPTKSEKRKHCGDDDDKLNAKRCKVGNKDTPNEDITKNSTDTKKNTSTKNNTDTKKVEEKDCHETIDVQAIASSFNETWLL